MLDLILTLVLCLAAFGLGCKVEQAELKDTCLAKQEVKLDTVAFKCELIHK